MKENRYAFLDIVSALFMVILLVSNFVGLYYITDGNPIASLLVSLIVIVFYFFILQFLKRSKEAMFRARFIHPSVLFFGLFILFGYGSYILLNHTLNVEFNVKTKIQEDSKKAIEQVIAATEEYKTRSHMDLEDFEAKLKQKLNNYKDTQSPAIKGQLLDEPYKVNKRILDRYPSDINVSAVTSKILDSKKSKIENTIKNYDSLMVTETQDLLFKFSNWDRLSVVKSFNSINSYAESRIRIINKEIKELPFRNDTIVFRQSVSSLPLNKPEELEKIFKSDKTLSLGIIIFIHLFILIPFLMLPVRVMLTNNTETKSDF